MIHTRCQYFLQGLDIAAKHFLDCEPSPKPERQQDLFVGSLTQFCNLDLTRFSYKKRGETCYINYYQAPEACFDDQEEMQHWAKAAFNVARVAAK